MDLTPFTLANRTTLLTLGMSPSTLARRVHEGKVIRLTASWYWTSATTPPALARATTASIVAKAVAGIDPVVSHTLAAHCHQLPGVPRDDRWDAVVPPGSSRPTRRGPWMHRYPIPEEDVVVVRGWSRILTPQGVEAAGPLQLTTPARTVADLFTILDETRAL